MAAQNASEDDIKQFAINVCIVINFQPEYACKMLGNSLWGEAWFMLQRTTYGSELICGSFVNNCGPDYNPIDEPWQVEIPGNKPPVQPWPNPKPNSPTLRVLHLSDIHIDRWYTVGSEADCSNGLPMNTYIYCCRNYTDNSDTYIRDFIKVPAGKWGSPYRCDIPFITFDNAMKHIANNEKFDYILMTGDLSNHAVWDYTKEAHFDNINNITAVLKNYFPNTLIIQAIGNHEAVPCDSMAPHTMEQYDTRGPQAIYNLLSKSWINWLPYSIEENMQYRASYSFRPFEGIKYISINSIYCSRDNFYLYINLTDPDYTLQWLVQELNDSESRGEKVHIIGHISSGASCLKAWSQNYYKIVNRYESTIAAQFFGHTHQDEFEIYYENMDPNGRPTSMVYMTPSLTTSSYNFPAYRIYTIDGNYSGSSWTVLDIENYYANITEANLNDQEPIWRLEYTAKSTYKMPDLSPTSWDNLTKNFLQENELFESFYKFYDRQQKDPSSCDATCKMSLVCALRTAESKAGKKYCL
uniref:Sphingomyelin phosphodiesterase n=1 Tax=Acrobeloides nanus TaxID=290746 RepID=A0A914C5R2_9BILA